MRSWLRARWMVILSMAIMSVALGGCQGLQTAERFRADAAQIRDQLRAEAQAWDERLAQLPPEHPLKGDAKAALALTNSRLAAVEAAIAKVDLMIEEARNPTDLLTHGIGGLAPLLPEPLRSPLVLGAALLVSLGRAAQLKRAMASTAQGIQKAIEEDDQFSAAFKRHANTFRAIQTETAKRIIDECTDKGFKIRLPI